MPAPLLDAAGWLQVRQDAIASGSLRVAADIHHLPYDAVSRRACRDNWPVGDSRRGKPAAIAAVDASRQRAIAAGSTAQAIVSVPVRPDTNALSRYLAEMGEQTRAMLATALTHAAGQARKTKHPLDRARNIHEVAKAAALIHGWQSEQGQAAGGLIGLSAVQINIGIAQPDAT